MKKILLAGAALRHGRWFGLGPIVANSNLQQLTVSAWWAVNANVATFCKINTAGRPSALPTPRTPVTTTRRHRRQRTTISLMTIQTSDNDQNASAFVADSQCNTPLQSRATRGDGGLRNR
jgi:hypothetical protein